MDSYLVGLKEEVERVLSVMDRDADAGRPLRLEQGQTIFLSVIAKALIEIADSLGFLAQAK